MGRENIFYSVIPAWQTDEASKALELWSFGIIWVTGVESLGVKLFTRSVCFLAQRPPERISQYAHLISIKKKEMLESEQHEQQEALTPPCNFVNIFRNF